jgi:hypothetical protein
VGNHDHLPAGPPLSPHVSADIVKVHHIKTFAGIERSSDMGSRQARQYSEQSVCAAEKILIRGLYDLLTFLLEGGSDRRRNVLAKPREWSKPKDSSVCFGGAELRFSGNFSSW